MRIFLVLMGIVVISTAPMFESAPLQSQGVTEKPSTELQVESSTRFMVDGVGDYEILMDRIMVEESTTPKLRAVGYVKIDAPDSHVAFKAKNSKREPVEVVKTEEDGVYEYLVLGSGKIFVDAISVDKTSGAIQWDDFVIVIGNAPDPEPDDPDEPDTPNDGTLRARVKAWAEQVNDSGSAQGIAFVYNEVSQELARGELTSDNVWTALREATDGVLEENESTEKWKGFRKHLTDEITEARQRGITATGIVDMIQEIRKGLQDASDGAAFMGFDRQSVIISKMNEAIRNAQRQ